MPQFQQTVYQFSGYGVPGESADDSPARGQPFILTSASASNVLYNYVARAYSILSEGKCQAGNPGGTYVTAGILVNPKAYANYSASLAATLLLPDNTVVEIASMGSFIITVPGACNIGDNVIYDNTTGILSTVAPGAALPVGSSALNAFIDRFTPAGAGLAVATFSSLPAVPVLAAPLLEAAAEAPVAPKLTKAQQAAADAAANENKGAE